MEDRLFLIARVAGRTVAISSEAVESVVDIDQVVTVPRTDARVRGLAALRSRVVTVLDPRIALGLGASDQPTGRAVVIGHGGHSYAILVDGLDDVATYIAAPLISGFTLDDAWSPIGRGLIERDGESLLVVDLAALVPEAALAA